jgi:hypothetical protein
MLLFSKNFSYVLFVIVGKYDYCSDCSYYVIQLFGMAFRSTCSSCSKISVILYVVKDLVSTAPTGERGRSNSDHNAGRLLLIFAGDTKISHVVCITYAITPFQLKSNNNLWQLTALHVST